MKSSVVLAALVLISLNIIVQLTEAHFDELSFKKKKVKPIQKRLHSMCMRLEFCNNLNNSGVKHTTCMKQTQKCLTNNKDKNCLLHKIKFKASCKTTTHKSRCDNQTKYNLRTAIYHAKKAKLICNQAAKLGIKLKKKHKKGKELSKIAKKQLFMIRKTCAVHRKITKKHLRNAVKNATKSKIEAVKNIVKNIRASVKKSAKQAQKSIIKTKSQKKLKYKKALIKVKNNKKAAKKVVKKAKRIVKKLKSCKGKKCQKLKKNACQQISECNTAVRHIREASKNTQSHHTKHKIIIKMLNEMTKKCKKLRDSVKKAFKLQKKLSIKGAIRKAMKKCQKYQKKVKHPKDGIDWENALK